MHMAVTGVGTQGSGSGSDGWYIKAVDGSIHSLEVELHVIAEHLAPRRRGERGRDNA